MKNLETAKKYMPYMVAARRWLHENPELSGKEYNTVAYIDRELTAMGVEHVVVENGGVLGFIRGSRPGKTVLLRADCDALPVQEKDNLKNCRTCWSKNPGVMHACGHDAHTAGLLGAAKVLLEKQSELEGTVILCFERGEEGAGNCVYLFAYMEKNGIKPDSCFGMHVSMAMPTGTIAINDTRVQAGSMSFKVTIEGRGGHGSRPDCSNNPLDCFAAIYQRMQSIRLLAVNPMETCTYSIGMVQAGSVGNVIPQTVTFAGTMRTYDSDTAGMAFYNRFREIIDGLCAAYGCKPIYDKYNLPGLATVNDPEYAVFARKALAEDFGAGVRTMDPSMGSESYAQYLKQWPGIYAHLGIANAEKGTGALNHNERFDLDEDALVYAAAAHADYALEFLKLQQLPVCAAKKLSHRELLKKQGKEELIPVLYGE